MNDCATEQLSLFASPAVPEPSAPADRSAGQPGAHDRTRLRSQFLTQVGSQIRLQVGSQVGPQIGKEVVINPHLLAARKIARKMRQLPDRSDAETRAGLAICAQLKAYLAEGQDPAPTAQTTPH